MLCVRDESGGRVLVDPGYVFELKLDGARILATKQGASVSLAYRRQRDASVSYPEIADAVRALPLTDVVLDGEVVAFDERGMPSFELLAHRIQARGPARVQSAIPVAYVVFDVLSAEGQDLRALPLEARRRALEAILPAERHGPGARIRLHPSFDDGRALMEFCRAHALEGVVAKRRGSRYRGERSADWVKVKRELENDFVVVGWTEGSGARGSLGALDLAAWEGDELVVRGSVGSGLDQETIDALLPELRALEVPSATARGRYAQKRERHFVRPRLVVSVRYTALTSEGMLRHPVFRGVRPDVTAEDCRPAGPRC